MRRVGSWDEKAQAGEAGSRGGGEAGSGPRRYEDSRPAVTRQPRWPSRVQKPPAGGIF
jgi:hypothetical protein